jgi:hypothetical protein
MFLMCLSVVVTGLVGAALGALFGRVVYRGLWSNPFGFPVLGYEEVFILVGVLAGAVLGAGFGLLMWGE